MEVKTLKLSDDVTCIASIDADLRVFDIIMETEFGTSYNSYIVKGKEKTALFETTKMPFWEDYLKALKENVDLNKIDYIVCDHTEPDHAGSMIWLVDNCPNATVVGSAAAIMFIKAITNKKFKAKRVKSGDKIDLGGKTLEFISAPFLHWPDSIFTYIPEEKMIMTCDVFGCHFADARMKLSLIKDRRADYEKALAYYYFVIMGPFKTYILDALEKIKGLDIKTVCVGHGPVLDIDIDIIKEKYKNWAAPYKKEDDKIKVFMGYVSAYGFTSKIGDMIKEELEADGKIVVEKYDISEEDHGKMNSIINKSDGIVMGSCTINSDAVMPVYKMLSHTAIPLNQTKPAAAFGSFGWSGEGPVNLEHRLKDLKFKIATPALKVNFLPSEKENEQIKEFARNFAAALYAKQNGDYELVGSKKWRCIVCGEVYEGELPPDICPACGVGSDKFEEVVIEDITYKSTKNEKFVIIGGGIAGLTAAESIRLRNSECTIEIYSDEKVLPYYRPKLTQMLLEDLDEDEVFVKPEKWFDENNIIIKLGEKIENVDPDNKTITTASGNKVSYDKLILAHGSYCLIPAIEGSKNKGVFALRHLDDLKNIKEHTSKIESVVVVGGGLLGLESAWHLSQLGKKVSILEISNRILPYQLNEDASYIYENVIKQKNIDIIKGKFVRRVLGSSDVEGIEFEDGTKLDAGAVIFAIGICPNRQLVENRGFKLNRGVDVNGKMETGINDVYACGDIAEFNGVVYGNWDAAINMAKVAGANAAGDNKVFKPAVKAYVLSAMDTEIFSTGDLGLDDKDFRAYSNKDYNANFYKKALFKNNMMCGSIIIGDTKDSLKYLRAVKEGATPEEFIEMGIL